MTSLSTSNKQNHKACISCDWLRSLSTFSTFIHVVACDRISFHSKADLHSIVCIYIFCWSVHPLVDTGSIPPFWLLWIMLLCTCMHRCLFETLLPILWGIYPGVGSLDHREILYLIFLRNCHTVFHGGYTLHSYQQCTRILISSHLHQHLPFTSLSFSLSLPSFPPSFLLL